MRIVLGILLSAIMGIGTAYAQSCSASFVSRIKGATSKAALLSVAEQAEEYLYGVGSEGYDEDLYIQVLEAQIESPLLSDIEKLRPQMLLQLALKNRPGHTAADIKFVTPDGSTHRLSETKQHFIILFFNDPDCDDCAQVKTAIENSDVINRLTKTGMLSVVGIYPYSDEQQWRNSHYPAIMVNGWDKDNSVECDELYDLRHMPTLYLLTNDMRVIFKDATLSKITDCLGSINE